ncbi:GAP family protein [Curtobacterium flaccumfaciens pv. oortii]|uniref:GAP family protein n=1 Tax=Curtobacterium flaccumfaciens TaxID=2035 RepID=UPI001BDF33B5|nr:GAP family protein [Curtobacterium flaccumfaciens]MBT1621346.1 GAP family protein [Curtobacterium flaccumfaciens pv. oortii]
MDFLALLPAVAGIALSPLPVASIVFLLGHRQGYGPAAACAVGWITAIVVALVVAVLVGERIPAAPVDGPPVQAIIALCASGLLFGLAAWQWSARRLPDGTPASSRWSEAMAAVGPGRAFGLGALLFVSPKTLVLVLTGGLVFGEADPSTPVAVVTAAVFVLASGSTALLPILLAATTGSHARRALRAMRVWIARWGSVGLVLVLVVLGTVQLVIGVSGPR